MLEASLIYHYYVSTHLEIKVVSIALNQFLRQFLLQELSQFVGINKAQRNHQHLGKEEEEETEGIKPDQKQPFIQAPHKPGENVLIINHHKSTCLTSVSTCSL